MPPHHPNHFPRPLHSGIAVVLMLGLLATTAMSATIQKSDNADSLNQSTSWLGGSLPGAADIAQWGSTVTGPNVVQLGADASWQGLSILNPSGPVTISSGNTLTMGRSGIDMSVAAQDLTIKSAMTLLTTTAQTWKVASGRTLMLDTGSFTRSSGSTLNLQGAGMVSATTISNDATGIVGPWASIGTGASTLYATLSSGTIIGYSGTAAATAANVTDTSGSVNYDVAGGGALSAAASFHTLRYTGATGSITGAFSANGIMNVGGGLLTFSNAITIGATSELVVNTANGSITAAAAITNNGANASTLIKSGVGTLTVSGTNTFTGGTVIQEGALSTGVAGGLGGSGNTVALAEGASLNLTTGGVAYTFGALSGAGTVNTTLGTGSSTITFPNSSLAGFTGVLNVGAGTGGGKLSLTAVTGGSSASLITVNPNGTLFILGGITVNAPLVLNGGDTGESFGQLRIEAGSVYAGSITLAGNITGTGDAYFGTPSGSATISGVIGESGGSRSLTKLGATNLTLSGPNTYSGATSILGGGLVLTANLGNAGSLSDVLGTSSSSASNLLLSNAASLVWAGSTAASTDRLLTINGATAGHGAVIWAQGTTSSNTLSFTNPGAIAYGSVDQSRILTLRGSNTGENIFAPAINDNGTGAVSMVKTDAGTWVLSGTSSYTGTTTLSAGTLSVSTSANLGSSTNTINFDGGTLRVTGTTLADLDTRTVTYGVNKLVTLSIADSTHTFTISQALTQGTGGLTKLGAGTLTLTHAGNNYTGLTTVAGGTLRVSGSGFLSTSSALSLTGADATLDLNGTSQTVKGFSGTSSGTAKILNNSGGGISTLTIGTGASNSTYAGQLADNNGIATGGKLALVHNLAGITTQLTPSSSNTYSGGTTVTAGTLQGNDMTAYTGASTTSAINPFGNGKITLNGGTLNVRIGSGLDATAQTLTLGNNIEVTANSTLSYDRQGGTTANKIVEFGSLTLGPVTLSPAAGNGYTAKFSSVLLTGDASIGGNVSSPLIFGPISETGGARKLTIFKSSAGAPITLTSASTRVGETSLAQVSIMLQHEAAFGTGLVTLAGAGVGVSIQSSKALTGSNKILNNITNTAGPLIFAGSNDLEIGGTLTTNATRSTTVTNTGKTIFSGAGINSAGGLNVSNGTGTIELATDLTLNSNGTALISGTGGTINSTGGRLLLSTFSGGGADIGTSGTLNINAPIANGSQSTLDFNHASGGTVILRGGNTYTGATNIQNATVDVISLNSVIGGTSSSSLGAPTTAVAGTIGLGITATTATLRYSGTGETTDRVINLAGTTGGAVLEQAGLGLLRFTGNFSATGVGAKTLTLTGSSSGVGEIAGAIVDNSGSNPTSLVKTGSGTWVLSGSSTYSGSSTVSAGILHVGISGSGQTGSGAVTIQNGGTLLGSGLVRGTTFTAQSGSSVHAGDGTAQNNYGTLSFSSASGPGSFDFQDSSSVVLGISPGGTGDLLSFDGITNGTLLFNGNMTVTAPAGYLPVSVETFNLLDWSNLTTVNFNSRYSGGSYSGYLLGNGDDILGFDLPDISSSGFGWDISQLISNGTISTVYVVPEPGRTLLFGASLLAALYRRRRHSPT